VTGSPLAELSQIAVDRLDPARSWSAAGRGPVIGVVGPDVPRELITALGGLAVRLHGRVDTDRELGDRYLGTGVDAWARALLASLLAGDWSDLDAVVVGRDSEASSRLFFALRELHRIGLADRLPPVLLCDVLHLPYRSTTRYVASRLGQLQEGLEDLTACRTPPGALAEAIAAHDRVRGLLRSVADVRRSATPRLNGSEALAVHAAVQAVSPDDAERLLTALLDELADRPPLTGVRLHLTGSSHDDPSVYRQLESVAAVIVSEDHDWGDLQWRRPVGESGRTALAERYQHNGPTAQRASAQARAGLLGDDLTAGRPDLVVAYVREHDDAPAWDVPAQQTVCSRHDVPLVLLEHQEYGQVDLAPVSAALDIAGNSTGVDRTGVRA
jgi:benzoyl-CoA reductase/2-hydroxyglutaryl-CoA dehydratase subunit BcrC/BadD/HgdB